MPFGEERARERVGYQYNQIERERERERLLLEHDLITHICQPIMISEREKEI